MTLLPALLIAVSLPADSAPTDTRATIESFCTAARHLNMANIPVNPQSPTGRRIANENSQLAISYPQMWDIAKAANIPACAAMW